MCHEKVTRGKMNSRVRGSFLSLEGNQTIQWGTEKEKKRKKEKKKEEKKRERRKTACGEEKKKKKRATIPGVPTIESC